MDTQGDLKWSPATGIQLRKAGVQFDAVQVDGDEGRGPADRLARMTGGTPGPVVVEEATDNRPVYFLVPALNGQTWRLTWRCRPTTPDHLVHILLLRSGGVVRALS
ncbi:hypothetical protein [Streptomyces hokutonensis]|uniref:hypothetical protein n=1 Tax=Streptomyces hokutonensis TaxID=1306990 RepID=UPI0005BE7BFE|nr:hypothetical protein [Streptomyces hokutonensis]